MRKLFRPSARTWRPWRGWSRFPATSKAFRYETDEEDFPIDLKNILRPLIAQQEGYSPDHSPADIVLDANESPYDLPAPIKQECFQRMEESCFNRYPDASSQRLKQQYAEYAGIRSDRMVTGNGSDELILTLLLACIEPGEKVLVPSPTFSMYGLLASQVGAQVESVRLTRDWSLPPEFIEASRTAKITFLSNPNNPTGNCFAPSVLKDLFASAGGLLVVDEAYYEFSGRTLMDRVGEDVPLVVLRTLSKGFGLAGLRMGFLIGPEIILQGVNTVRLPYNLNELSQIVGTLALERKSELLKRNDVICSEREKVSSFLEEKGLRPCPSQANFVLFQPADAHALHKDLLERGIRIRKFSEPELRDYLRVTVGTPDQNRRFMDTLDELT